MTNYGKLVKEVVHLLDRFDPDSHCPENFIEDALKGLKGYSVLEEAFILEALSGCIEYQQLLDIVVDAFYARAGKNCLLSDRHLYAVICYLATFQLDEIGLAQFSKVINSQDKSKMFKFLRFFFDDTSLRTWVKDEWSGVYDGDFVKKTWIEPLLRWQPEVAKIVSQLSDKIIHGFQPAKGTKNQTEAKEFNLTKSKPRGVPMPEKIAVCGKHQEVPLSTYKAPKVQLQLEESKLKNRQRAEAGLLEANINQFRCANSEKSEYTKKRISQLIQEDESKLKFHGHQAKELPASHKNENFPIRLNTTAILREKAFYNRRVEQELQKIEKLLEGARDPSEFLEWQRQMREIDMEQELAEVERRRLEGKLSHEEAVLARHKIMEDNKKKAIVKKEETAELMQRYAEKRMANQKEMKELVKQVAQGHKNAKQAKVIIQECKHKIVQEVTEESRELLRQALERAEAELCRKLELIRQIRAMESIPFIRHKFVDHTQTSGQSLLSEMSLVELHERLVLLKEAQKKEEEEKREKIVKEKQAKQQFIQDQIEEITLHRAAMREAAVIRREEKKAKSEKLPFKDESILELQKKIEEKRQERQRLSESQRIKPDKRPPPTNWNLSQNLPEEQSWQDLEKSLERQVELLKHGN
ncbi:cilia- and flagella-associated protein 99 [Polypterus senegalus]|uniref:cilia- and flagella-associated protein 99 n=1 Tax=Polypterus senegalus TaxID=55291 RepID=UPI001962815A|nr:cilia- and flagella-associated protein 99 [Polypterus senegalus]XP_039607668.1 cilia- and flagella-associated protein 99 [Polypterus senegalus]XP_039607669.1 cilia- and flagella-associated protein 99 [Polypterus senegalus]